MTLDSSLIDLIVSDSDINALIGQRIYPNNLPQRPQFPCLLFKRVDSERDYPISGPADLEMPVIEISTHSADYLEARLLVKYLKILLDGLRGLVGDVAVVQILFREGKNEWLDLLQVHRATVSLEVWHTE